MIIKCISNAPSSKLKANKYIRGSTGSNLEHFFLTVGREYQVLAIAKIKQAVMYYIFDDDQDINNEFNDSVPSWYDKDLFDIVDRHIPVDWMRTTGTAWTKDGETESFPAFITNFPKLYSDVVDMDEQAVQEMISYAKTIKK